MKFIKINFTLSSYILHISVNVFKEILVRIKSTRVLIWVFFLVASFYTDVYVGIIVAALPFMLGIMYLAFELFDAIKYYRYNFRRDTSHYGLFYNNESFHLFNGDENGEQIRYDEVWIVFDNKITRSLTLYLKKDNSFFNVFRSDTNSVNFDEFKTIALKKIKHIK